MSTQRFAFQRECVERALAQLDAFHNPHEDPLPAVILNVGCNDDPGDLKLLDRTRVVNCDLFNHDQVLDRANKADVLFDCAREHWPFNDGAAELVVLGDILEHLTPGDIARTLAEARRVSRRLCVTVPEDDRDETSNERADAFPRGAVHRTIVTRPLLAGLLAAAGWHVTGWQTIVYDDGACWGKQVNGHFIQAE